VKLLDVWVPTGLEFLFMVTKLGKTLNVYLSLPVLLVAKYSLQMQFFVIHAITRGIIPYPPRKKLKIVHSI